MEYEDALEYILSLERFGMKLGLQNISYLDRRMGGPAGKENMYVHVTGTNGKGTCSETAAAVISALGYECGLFTSPHVVDARERIRSGGRWIPEEIVIRFVEENRSLFERMSTMKNVRHPTFFEVLTALALYHFDRSGMQRAVLEVGLGGRLDATNVISRPIVTIITSVGIDHTMQLGDTLASIAREKAGIIKDGRPVLLGIDRTHEAFGVIEEMARRSTSPLFHIARDEYDMDPGAIRLTWDELSGNAFTLHLNGGSHRFTTRSSGREQMINVALGIIGGSMAATLSPVPVVVDDPAMSAAVADLGIPGRFEVFAPRGNRREIVLDIAHNPDAARSLARTLRVAYPGGVDLLFASMRDKETSLVLGSIADMVRDVYLFELPMERARNGADMTGIVKSVMRKVPRAVLSTDDEIRTLVSGGVPLLVMGSLFLVSRVRHVLVPSVR